MTVKESVSTARNPTNLPARYEIRRLTSAHAQWASAIVWHSNVFHSRLFAISYPDAQGARFNKLMAEGDYLVNHQIDSGMSFGVFDTEYQFKRSDSAATKGKFYWDPNDDNVDSQTLLEQMDFPLVSIALAYDGINAFDMEKITPLIETLPLFGLIYHILEEKDPRDPASWKPTGPNQVLMRNATSTRLDYEGQKVMSQLARFLMREAKSRGYRGIQIETLNDRVEYVWANPPKPFVGKVISSEESATYELTDEHGDRVKPFAPSTQRMAKVFVSL